MPGIGIIIAGVALDGEDDRTVFRAAQLATQHGAELLLVHVIENVTAVDRTSTGALDMNAVNAMLAREAEERLESIIARAGPNPRWRVVVAQGRPFEAIANLLH